MSKSNLIFATKESFSIALDAGGTFNITNDFELDTSVELTEETSIELKNAVQLERMTITATGGVVTIVKRGLTQGDEPVEDVNLRKPWGDGETVYVTQLAFNIFDIQDDNTITDTKRLFFGTTSAYIYTPDSGLNMIFKDGSNAEINLSTIAAAAGADTKVSISTLDTTPSQLEDKLTGGEGITLTKVNPAGNESFNLDVDLTDANTFTTIQGNADKALKTDFSGNIDDSFQSSDTVKGIQRISTDAEALAGTLENVTINPKQAKDNYNTDIQTRIVASESWSSSSTAKSITVTGGRNKMYKVLINMNSNATNINPTITLNSLSAAYDYSNQTSAGIITLTAQTEFKASQSTLRNYAGELLLNGRTINTGAGGNEFTIGAMPLSITSEDTLIRGNVLNSPNSAANLTNITITPIGIVDEGYIRVYEIILN